MADPQARPASEADFTFQAGDLTTADLKVTAFTGTEGLNELYEFHVDLCSDNGNIDLATLVGKPCTLEIIARTGSRFVNGIVRRFERVREGANLTYYAAEVVPVHWLLTRRIKSRIFQESSCPDMTVPGIIKKVFQDAGIPEDNFRFALERTYEKREYVVQYRESEMNFIARLMEDEGIFYFFEHTNGGYKMVLGDSGVANSPTPDESEFPYRDPSSLVAEI